jgi:hypothetical protein
VRASALLISASGRFRCGVRDCARVTVTNVAQCASRDRYTAREGPRGYRALDYMLNVK